MRIIPPLFVAAVLSCLLFGACASERARHTEIDREKLREAVGKIIADRSSPFAEKVTYKTNFIVGDERAAKKAFAEMAAQHFKEKAKCLWPVDQINGYFYVVVSADGYPHLLIIRQGAAEAVVLDRWF